MNNLNLKAYKVSHIELVNSLNVETKLELKNQYSHNVKYAKNNTCEGILKVDISDKNGNTGFHIAVTVQGIFAFENSSSKEELHVQTFKELFPYARTVVSTITSTAGMPPVFIPPIDIENQEIYRIDMNPNLHKDE